MFANVGKISAMKGDVTINRDAKIIKAEIGSILEKNDIINTKKSARVQVVFKDKTVISIGKNSAFHIEDYIFSESKKPKATFGLTKGFFKTITGKIGKINPEGFKLKTKTASIGIRGTIILVEVEEDLEKIICTEGKIRVATPQGWVDVESGKLTTISPYQAPAPVRIATKNEKEDLEKTSGAVENEKESGIGEKSIAEQIVAKEEAKETGKKEEKEEKSKPEEKNAQIKGLIDDTVDTPALADTTSKVIQDFSETRKKTVVPTVWHGIVVSNLYDKSTDNFLGNSTSINKQSGTEIAKDNILLVNEDGKVTTARLSVVQTMEGSEANIFPDQDYKNLDSANSAGTHIETTGHYEDYMAWGSWSKTNGGINYPYISESEEDYIGKSYWIAGALTSPNEVPTSGSATYTGSLAGSVTNGNTRAGLEGTTSITADFSNNQMSGRLNINYTNGGDFATAELSSVNINRQEHGVEFLGDLTGSNINSGKIGGAFYGTDAGAIGGVWQIETTDAVSVSADGTFEGKK